MRTKLGFLFLALIAVLVTPVNQPVHAFGGLASAPLNLSQTAISGGIRVTWSAPTDVDSGITGYRVEYSTSGTAGTWNLWTTTGSGIYTSDILGLSQSATYVRVAATTSAGVGTYGYPWTKLYGVTSLNRNASGYPIYESGYGVGGSDPFSTLSSAAFTRIRWRVETTISGVSKYADADSYEWVTGNSAQSVYSYAPSVASVMVPSPNAPYAYTVHANVTDLNVYSDNTAVTNGRGLNGRLEIWPWDYNYATSGLAGVGNTSTFDYDDTSALSSNYGSFQIHDMSNLKPVFAWNHQAYGQVADFGYGANPTGNPDWTFCYQGGSNGTCTTPSSFKLQIYVNIPLTPLADSTPPTVSRIDGKTLAKNGDTLTVRSTELGSIYLVKSTNTVTNLASITSAAANTRNSVSVTTANSNTVLTTSGLLDGTYNLYAADLTGNLSTVVNNTITMDTTQPGTTSVAVSSNGQAIIWTVNETVTVGSFSAALYSVSDSGSAMTVTNATAVGNVITLTLSRTIPAGASVSFSWIPASYASVYRWYDAAGNQLYTYNLATITNNSISSATADLTLPATIYKGSATTISLVVSVAGKVTFTFEGKRIPGCIGKSATGTTPITVTCSWKPSKTALGSFGATLTPTNNLIASVRAIPVTRYILKRSTLR